ncbi:MAG: GNAT family N-acetyltransferase [Eubacterium sp.]|jgi:ribosomal protein S18 acetylase RimI-like enzyme|nr:GNAT family N-acetyltransferase [Eubacterium sp.]
MIIEVKDEHILKSLGYKDIYEGKIKVLYRAYGIKQNFCSFFMQDKSLLISRLDRDYIIKIFDDDYDAEELAAFLNASNAKGLFLPSELLKQLAPYVHALELRYCGIMEYRGGHKPDIIDGSPDLTDIFNILKNDFYIEYSSWLTDVSHRVRHGISKVFLYRSASTVTALYDADGQVFLTQVATKSELRGQGLASGMLKEVAGRYTNDGKITSLVCRNALIPFYEKTGFVKTGEAALAFL